jgi:ATPase subunit of ABC transporter with duplicated ATPase domains
MVKCRKSNNKKNNHNDNDSRRVGKEKKSTMKSSQFISEDNNNNYNSTTTTTTTMDRIIGEQLQALDDTDMYASAWEQALNSVSNNNNNNNKDVFWGGRGQGGRGVVRKNLTTNCNNNNNNNDIVLSNVSLEYTADVGRPAHMILQDTTLKILLTTTNTNNNNSNNDHDKVYAVVGRNGCGKSTLLRRINSGKIPGFPPHITTMYIPQEVLLGTDDDDDIHPSPPPSENQIGFHTTTKIITPLEYVLKQYRKSQLLSLEANELRILELEQMLDDMLLVPSDNNDTHEVVDNHNKNNDDNDDNNQKRIEDISEEICMLEYENETCQGYLLNNNNNNNNNNNPQNEFINEEMIQNCALQCLSLFGISQFVAKHTDMKDLSGGILKKCALACALLHQPRLLLLDEPSNFLDIPGLIQLRQCIAHLSNCSSRTMNLSTTNTASSSSSRTTILIVSHDVDLINDVATDVIYFANQKLSYFPGNYRQFLRIKDQIDLHKDRQSQALNFKRHKMLQTIDQLKKEAGIDQKKARALSSRKKKLLKAGIEKNSKGHRWKSQDASTGKFHIL